MSGNASSAFLSNQAVQNALAEIVVQYAGDQAWTAGNLDQGASSTEAVSHTQIVQKTPQAMTVTLDPARWETTFQNGGTDCILGEHDFVKAVFQQAGYKFYSSDVKAYLNSWISTSSSQSALDYLVNNDTEILMALQPNATLDASNAQPTNFGSSGGAIIVSGSGGTVEGSSGNDLIIGGDAITAGNGNDLIVAQDADATINLGAGSSDVVGFGAGDTVVLTGPRCQYDITKSSTYAGMVLIDDTTGCAVDQVINVGSFKFADTPFETHDQLFEPNAVGINACPAPDGTHATGGLPATGGCSNDIVPQQNAMDASPMSETSVGDDTTFLGTYIGSVASLVGTQDDVSSTTYAINPSDTTAQNDYTLTTNGLLYLKPGVQVDASVWDADFARLIDAGWNLDLASGLEGDMAPDGDPTPILTSAQQQTEISDFLGSPFAVTVDVNDPATGTSTTQTLVIPVLDAANADQVDAWAHPIVSNLWQDSDDSPPHPSRERLRL